MFNFSEDLKSSLIVFVIFATLFFIQWERPAHVDEIFFHRAAHAWYLSGPQLDGLWHTPFYLEGLRFWQKIFGPADPEHVNRLRSFGFFTSLLTLCFFLLALREIRKPDTLSASPLLASALLLWHPYFIQSSLLLDIDNTLLTSAILAWTFIALRWARILAGSWPLTFLLSILLAFNLMVKELTPLLIFPIWIIWAALLKRRSSHLIQALVGSALALALFWLALFAWTNHYGFSWRQPLALTFDKSGGRLSGYTPWNAFTLNRWLFISYLTLLWLGLPTLAIFLIPSLRDQWKALRRGTLNEISLPLILAAGIWSAYIWLYQASFYFPKYTAVVWPLLLLGAAPYIDLPKLKRKEGRTIQGFRFMSLGFLFFAPLLTDLFDSLYVIEMRRDPVLAVLVKHIVALVFVVPVYFLGRMTKGSEKKSWPLYFLLVFFLSQSFVHAFKRENAHYLYGEEGFRQTVNSLKALEKVLLSNQPLSESRVPILTTAIDLQWALQSKARFSSLERFEIPPDALIIASRTYDNYSLRTDPTKLAQVEREFPCHSEATTKRSRFEWWWKPLNGTCSKIE